MKVIFLDFDGVINNWYKFDGVDTRHLDILKEIIDITGAKVVATTSNKYNYQLGHVTYEQSSLYQNYIKVIEEYGITIDDLTPCINGYKDTEIKEYVKENDVTDYVIIDDEYISDELRPHQVFLDLYKGVSSEHINPVINILNGNLGFYPEYYTGEETPAEQNLRNNLYYKDKVKPLEYGRIVAAALFHNDSIYIGREGHHVIFPMEPIGVLRCAEQGFVTEQGYFVDRITALHIADYYDQINKKYNPQDRLVSEDLKKEHIKILSYKDNYSYKEKSN